MRTTLDHLTRRENIYDRTQEGTKNCFEFLLGILHPRRPICAYVRRFMKVKTMKTAVRCIVFLHNTFVKEQVGRDKVLSDNSGDLPDKFSG